MENSESGNMHRIKKGKHLEERSDKKLYIFFNPDSDITKIDLMKRYLDVKQIKASQKDVMIDNKARQGTK